MICISLKPMNKSKLGNNVGYLLSPSGSSLNSIFEYVSVDGHNLVSVKVYTKVYVGVTSRIRRPLEEQLYHETYQT